MGIKAYDMISGRQLVKSSYFVSKSKALEEFPMLKDDRLCGAIVYYDGQSAQTSSSSCSFMRLSKLRHPGITSLLVSLKPPRDFRNFVVSSQKN